MRQFQVEQQKIEGVMRQFQVEQQKIEGVMPVRQFEVELQDKTHHLSCLDKRDLQGLPLPTCMPITAHSQQQSEVLADARAPTLLILCQL